MAPLYAADKEVITVTPAEKSLEHEVQNDSERNGIKPGVTLKEMWLTNLTVGNVTLRKLTYGTRHTYHTMHTDSEANSIFIWYTIAGSNDSLAGHDVEFSVGSPHAQSQHTVSSTGASGSTVYGFELTRWPRRNPSLPLRITRNDPINLRTSLLGKVVLTNLAFQPYPVWVAQRLPATHNLGDFNITIHSTSTNYFSPRFSFLSRSGEGLGWHVANFWFADPMGNTGYSANDLPNEPVLKLTAHLFRATNGLFRPEETWSIPITIPASGRYVTLATNREAQGVKIQLVALCGQGETTYSNMVPIGATSAIDPDAQIFSRNVCRWGGLGLGRQNAGSPPFIKASRNYLDDVLPPIDLKKTKPLVVVSYGPHVAVRFDGLTPEHRIYVGNETVSGNSPGSWSNARDGIYFLPGPEKGQSELRFVVQKRRTVEFLVPAGGLVK